MTVTLEGDEKRVVVRGDNVASGYVGAPGEASDGEYLDGAFRTGDTGRFDENGRLHLTGRIGSLVNISGRKINPSRDRVESRAAGLSQRGRRAGCERRRAGRGAGGVRREGQRQVGPTRETVISHLRGSLAPYKIPRRVIFVEELPRNPRGKLDHETLRRLAMEERDGAS